MGLMDYIKTQLLEIIQWEDDSRDTLSWRFPDQDKEIKNGAQLIVRESQVAQFVHLGQFADTFGPGKHTLKTENIPVLSTLMGWKFGFESPFKCDVYYVNTRLFTGNKWGTSNPIMLRDPDFGIVRVRAFGTYDFKVADVKVFLKEVAGTDHHFRIDEFQDSMRSRFVSVFSDALASAKLPVLDVASRYSELGEALLPVLNPVLREKYGIELGSFIVENVSVPAEVETAIDKRSSMAAIGNLNDYVKLQLAESLGRGESGGAGVAGLAASSLSAPRSHATWATRRPRGHRHCPGPPLLPLHQGRPQDFRNFSVPERLPRPWVSPRRTSSRRCPTDRSRGRRSEVPGGSPVPPSRNSSETERGSVPGGSGVLRAGGGRRVGVRRLGGRRPGLLLLGVGDDTGAEYDQADPEPTEHADLLAEDQLRSQRRQDESQGCQRPNEADVPAAHQVEQAAEERGLEGDSQEKVPIGGSGADHPEHFGHSPPFHLADLLEPAAEEHDPHRLQDEAGGEDDEQSCHSRSE
jgi:membrane protease subunit (stomatin/prohibitin family)